MKVACLCCLLGLGLASSDFDDASALLQRSVDKNEAPWDPLFDAVVKGTDKLPGINDLKAQIAIERLKTDVLPAMRPKIGQRKRDRDIDEKISTFQDVATMDDRASLRQLMGHWRILKRKGRGPESDFERGTRKAEMFTTQARIADIREKIRQADRLVESTKPFVKANLQAAQTFKEQVAIGNPYAVASQNNFNSYAGAGEYNQKMAQANMQGWQEGQEAAKKAYFEKDDDDEEFMSTDKLFKESERKSTVYAQAIHQYTAAADARHAFEQAAAAASATQVTPIPFENDEEAQTKAANHNSWLKEHLHEHLKNGLESTAADVLRQAPEMHDRYKDAQARDEDARAWAVAQASNGLPQTWHPKVVKGEEIEQKLKEEMLRRAAWSGDGD